MIEEIMLVVAQDVVGLNASADSGASIALRAQHRLDLRLLVDTDHQGVA